jgi:flagellar hook-basal body complex protein FliE
MLPIDAISSMQGTSHMHSSRALTSSQVEHVGEVRQPDIGQVGGSGTDLAASFSHVLSEARATDNDAADKAVKFANGDPSVGIHEVIIASEKANIAVRYAATLKNKALEAYKELMGTQV